MNSKQLSMNGLQFYSGLAAGINNLLDYKNKLDEINVYPVPALPASLAATISP